MEDPNPSNHWDLLASNLGVTPPLESEEPQRPAPPPQPMPARPPKSPSGVRPPAAPSAIATNWDSLAVELGVASAPPSTHEAKQPQEPEKPLAAARERPAPSLPTKAEESPNYFDEPFDFEEPFDLLESPGAAPEAPEAETDATSESTEPEKRSRRRRRRRRPGRQHESGRPDAREPPAPDAQTTDRSTGLVVDAESDLAAAVADRGGPGADGESPAKTDEEEAGQPRSKRRRPRRGRKRPPGDESPPDVAGEPVAEGQEPGPETLDHDEDLSDLGEAGADEEAGPFGDRPARLGFRNIPTWEETVGMLVTKNLEARAKRPGGGQRPRGNRGGRGDRRR
jgi:hypothetical protein